MARLPEVATYVERAADGFWDLVIQCPYCGDLHRHGGGGDADPVLGQRLSHCVRDGRRGDYVLVPGSDDMPKPTMKTAGWRRREWDDLDNGRASR